MATQNGDSKQEATPQEKARRNHLKTLHRRTRFRERGLLEDHLEPSRGARRSLQIPSVFPANSSQLFPQVMSSNIPSYPCNNSYLLHQPYYRRYSLASYQPLYVPSLPLMTSQLPYYYPHPGFHPVGARGRMNSENVVMNGRTGSDLTEENDDDDVFAPSISSHITLNPPLSSPLNIQERRKRARSAGEMISEPTLFSSNAQAKIHNMVRISQHSPENAAICLSNDPPCQKPSSSSNHQVSVPTPLKKSEICTSYVAPTSCTSYVAPTSCTSYVAPTPDQSQITDDEVSEADRKKICMLPATKTAQQELPLKSSLSWNRSKIVRKKVLWNDQTEKRKNGYVQTKKRSNISLKVEKIKSNPERYTTKNKIGPYLIGPKLGSGPVECISQYLVRKAGSNKYYMVKLLTLGLKNNEVHNGKMLLHTEYSLLTLLTEHPGVIRHYGMFRDHSFDGDSLAPRVGLILDCLTPHEYDPSTNDFLNLQQYVIQAKRLTERETIRIFHLIVTVVSSLHQINVVHRDLKLGNMVLNKRTRRVTLTNFCLGCHSNSERVLLTDQRGSPAYISPDVLSGKPYAGKPSDMWSLGVVLYIMLYGQFPFYDKEPKKLFAKIKHAEYIIPNLGSVSNRTNDIIRGLLTLNTSQRLTAHQTLAALESCATMWNVLRAPSAPAQVVPDVDSDVMCNDTCDSDSDIQEQQMTLAFEQKLLSDDDDADCQVLIEVSQTLNQLPNACHVNHDALPLSHEEMNQHQRLLSHQTGSQIVAT